MAENPAAAALEERSERCSAPEPKVVVAPWLVNEYYQGDKTYHAVYNICGPKNETCRGFMPELIGTTCYQKTSHQGWLILVCHRDPDEYATHGSTVETPPGCSYGDCFLWNPTTNETIVLPSILEYFKREYLIFDCVLSSPPHSNSYSMVFILFYHQQQHSRLVFCRPRETQWRIHTVSPDLLSERIIEAILCFKGKLHIMCAETDDNPQDDPLEHHLEIEHITTDTDLTISFKSFHVKKEVCLFPLVGGKNYSTSHYVESHDEIFKVDIIRDGSTSEVISIEVVRLNFVLMEWEKVNSFGDHVLFVNSQYNHSTTYCCSAAELGFTSGCLYYLLDSGQFLYKFQIESTGNTFIFPSLWTTESLFRVDWVIMPINVQQGRVLENMSGSKDEENGFLENETSTTMVVDDENEGGVSSAGDVEVASYWNNLSDDIVGLIANLLHGSDYKHFRLVSKANRTIIPKVQATSFLSPWMVYSRDHNFTIFSVINPMYHDENYVMNLSELAADSTTIRFQKGGWLLLTRKHNIFFYNPFTREMVKLPHIDRHYCYTVVSFSSSPTSSDCIVFAMDERDDQVYINFIRRGEAHWSSLIFHRDRYISFLDIAVFHDGAFFCVDYEGTFGVFSVKDNSWKVLEKPHELYGGDNFPCFLVECGGDLLLVKLEYLKTLVRIFRLSFSEMEWVKVESLGEHTLFVSHTSCVSAVAPNSYMKNKIYFPRLHTKDGGIVFYSLETLSYHTLGNQHSANNLCDRRMVDELHLD